MQNFKLQLLLLISLLGLIFASCSPTRNIPEGQYLLNRNRIETDDLDVDGHKLRSHLQQTPNRRLMGFYRFHLSIYQMADRGKENRFKSWLKNNIGEPPVIYDPALANHSGRQLELFLQNRGYFNAEVNHELSTRRKRANVTYTITGDTPYAIRNIDYHIRDEHLAPFVYADTINSLLISGDRYDAELLHQERQRMTRHLKNEGFYNFSRDFIFFQVDSTLNNKQVDLDVIIDSPRARFGRHPDSLHSLPHKRYKINNIYIYPEYRRLNPDIAYSDTTRLVSRKDPERTYTFLHNEPLKIKPTTIVNNILFEPGTLFNQERLEQTHHYLAGLRNFRYVNLRFMEADQPEENAQDTLGFLDGGVELTRAPSNAFTIEAEGLNTAGNLGIASNFLYQNRNVFGGAEILSMRLKGALEVSGESSDDEIFQRLPFNTVELGAEVSVDFPKLLFPVGFENLSRTARPQTTILSGFNYRQRPDYTRYIINFSYGVRWGQDARHRHHLTPLEVSSIKIFNDSILQSNIPDDNPLILSRYRDHLIGGMKYNYTYSTQHIDRETDFVYFRTNLESAGNLMYLAAEWMDLSTNEESNYTLRDIPFAQYLKADADFRYYRVLDENNALVFRIMGGMGIPYGNTDVMPFIKSYYGGGANSVRAWSIYNLGPGGYEESDLLRFDKYGDIKLEANVEYRFPIYRYWHGAFFMDAGNVWFLQENKQFPRGEFRLDRFYREIAIGLGAGVRLDFNFFLVRLDAAFPLHNPAMPSGDRWADGLPSNWNFNLGIGYPF